MKPKLKKEIDLKELKEICVEYIEYLDSEDYCEDNSYDVDIFEQAMKTLYGDGVFDYINDKI